MRHTWPRHGACWRVRTPGPSDPRHLAALSALAATTTASRVRLDEAVPSIRACQLAPSPPELFESQAVRVRFVSDHVDQLRPTLTPCARASGMIPHQTEPPTHPDPGRTELSRRRSRVRELTSPRGIARTAPGTAPNRRSRTYRIWRNAWLSQSPRELVARWAVQDSNHASMLALRGGESRSGTGPAPSAPSRPRRHAWLTVSSRSRLAAQVSMGAPGIERGRVTAHGGATSWLRSTIDLDTATSWVGTRDAAPRLRSALVLLMRAPPPEPSFRPGHQAARGDGTTQCSVVPRGEPVDSWPTGLPLGSADLASRQGLPGSAAPPFRVPRRTWR